MGTLHAFEFLESDNTCADSSFFALFGDDRFLQVLVRQRLLTLIAGGEADFDTAIVDGDSARWPDILDRLTTVSLFSQGSSRVAVVENADEFVKRHRIELEKLADHPPRSGRLVLMVQTWPANTRLFRAFDKCGCQIRCAEPQSKRGSGKSRDTAAICRWIAGRANTAHGLSMTQTQVRQLMEIVEWSLGRADQELAKLALFGTKVDEQTIRAVVGGWRAQSIWDAAASATQGKTDEALAHLASLIQSGEHPLALYGQLAWSLRRYGRLWEIISRQIRRGQRADLSVSLASAGFRAWGGELDIASASVTQLTRSRVRQFYCWLQETDLSLKGTHSDPSRARFALEKLFFQMARIANPQAGTSATGKPENA
jgi:DNA polymerase-3 subunit delta